MFNCALFWDPKKMGLECTSWNIAEVCHYLHFCPLEEPCEVVINCDRLGGFSLTGILLELHLTLMECFWGVGSLLEGHPKVWLVSTKMLKMVRCIIKWRWNCFSCQPFCKTWFSLWIFGYGCSGASSTIYISYEWLVWTTFYLLYCFGCSMSNVVSLYVCWLTKRLLFTCRWRNDRICKSCRANQTTWSPYCSPTGLHADGCAHSLSLSSCSLSLLWFVRTADLCERDIADYRFGWVGMIKVLLGHSPFMSLSHWFDCFCFTLLFSHALYSKFFLLLLVFLIW